MYMTVCWEIPHHCSVKIDDLFHTHTGLCTTLLLPSGQISINKHYHSDIKDPNKWADDGLNICWQKHVYRKAGNSENRILCPLSATKQQFMYFCCESDPAYNMGQNWFSTGCYQTYSPLFFMSGVIEESNAPEARVLSVVCSQPNMPT